MAPAEDTTTTDERFSELTAEVHCGADWRRPGRYWRCDREFGHRGRHHLVEVAVHQDGTLLDDPRWDLRPLVTSAAPGGRRRVA